MNTRNITYSSLFGLGLVFATLSGCSGNAVGGGVAAIGQRPGGRQVQPAMKGAVADPAENAVGTSTSDDDNGQPDGINDKTDESQLTYPWPNPDRSEIFLPPASKPVGATIASRDEYGVALVGFANVDRKQVLLKIDGVIAPLAEGDSRGELRVLAIDPPEVTLKRGDREWTVKLFDLP